MGTKMAIVEPEKFYHIYNRAVGNELLFRTRSDYLEWLNGLKECILPVSEIHAYNLLPNHYHLLIRSLASTHPGDFSKQLNRLQSSYAIQYNRKYYRKGGLFHRPYGRKPVKNDAQLAWLLWYIHRNPMHHQITDKWDTYSYSSYTQYCQQSSELVTTTFMLNFFGGLHNLKNHHQLHADAFEQQFRIITGE